MYNKEICTVRTGKVNALFAEIAVFTGLLTKKPNDNFQENHHLASSVVLPIQFSNFFIEDLKRLASLVA